VKICVWQDKTFVEIVEGAATVTIMAMCWFLMTVCNITAVLSFNNLREVGLLSWSWFPCLVWFFVFFRAACKFYIYCYITMGRIFLVCVLILYRLCYCCFCIFPLWILIFRGLLLLVLGLSFFFLFKGFCWILTVCGAWYSGLRLISVSVCF